MIPAFIRSATMPRSIRCKVVVFTSQALINLVRFVKFRVIKILFYPTHHFLFILACLYSNSPFSTCLLTLVLTAVYV